jgi:hypothetical protein
MNFDQVPGMEAKNEGGSEAIKTKPSFGRKEFRNKGKPNQYKDKQKRWYR